MVLIIHHVQAWAQAVEKYDIDNLAAPTSYPVLLTIQTGEEGEYIDGAGIIYPVQAAKLLSVCTPERIMALPETIRMSIYKALAFGQSTGTGKKSVILQPLLKITPQPGSTLPQAQIEITAVDKNGNSISFSTSHSSFSIGNKVTTPDNEFVITQIGDKFAASDPITGEDGIVEVKDEETTAAPTISGLEEVPMDPSKFEEKHKIADLGDPTSHVLDVERDV